MVASRTRNTTHLGARYHRLAPRLGKKKTIVAVEHSILTALWRMLTHDLDYHDLGEDYFTRRNPDRAMRNIIRQANALGIHRPLRPHPDRLTSHSTYHPHQQVPVTS
jgi:transposase